VLVGGGSGSGKAFGRLIGLIARLYLTPEMDKLGAQGVAPWPTTIRLA
jgi:hypothetical protein